MSKTDPAPRGVHMSEREVAEALTALDADPSDPEGLRARLAWRPAWAIRSRRGALAAFLSLLRDRPES